MKIKKGDNIIVIAGKDRGKSGAVLTAFPKKDMVLVAGIGMIKKHQKSTRRGQAGQIVNRPTPIHVSNVAIKDSKTSKPSRIGYTMFENKKVRVSKASGTKI
jgi:large subunit ribosomal protein L24